jgi:monoamine oxidase
MDKQSTIVRCSRRGTTARPRVAIVGGGPSGLFTAHLLERQSGIEWRITLLEASVRLGGKMHTRRFDAAPVLYEAGVAECYDFHEIGPDPLRALVRDLGIGIVPTRTGPIVFKGAILHDDRDILRHFGRMTRDAIVSFRAQATAMLPLAAWHRGFGVEDDLQPWAGRTAQAILDDLPDPVAREYFRIACHSDMATEPHRVSGLIGLRNVLKSLPVYGAQYTIDGGMEMLPRRLAESLTRTRVLR